MYSSVIDYDESPIQSTQESNNSNNMIHCYMGENKEFEEDEVHQYTNTEQYQFVIGIIKPGQLRIGLQTVDKNKITISGKLGIRKYYK